MDKHGTNWTMDGLPIEGGFDVAAAEEDDEEVTNNCDYCGKELDGPWDDFCEEHQDRADDESESDQDKEGGISRSASATSFDIVDADRAEYNDGWDKGFEDAFVGIIPDMSELLSGIHSLDWEAGYLDGQEAGTKESAASADVDDPNWMPGFGGGTIGKTAGGEEDYDEGWDQAWADAQHGNLPDPEDFTGTHSIDWEAGYQDYLAFGDRDESLPWDPDEDEDDWIPIEASNDSGEDDAVWWVDNGPQREWGPSGVVVPLAYGPFPKGLADQTAQALNDAYGGSGFVVQEERPDHLGDWSENDLERDIREEGIAAWRETHASTWFNPVPGECVSCGKSVKGKKTICKKCSHNLAGIFASARASAQADYENPRDRMSSDDLKEAMVEIYDRWELANAKGSPECDTLARTYLVLDDELARRGMVLAEDDSADDQQEGLPWLEDVELETLETKE